MKILCKECDHRVLTTNLDIYKANSSLPTLSGPGSLRVSRAASDTQWHGRNGSLQSPMEDTILMTVSEAWGPTDSWPGRREPLAAAPRTHVTAGPGLPRRRASESVLVSVA
jgi:hypothetical protein